MPHSQRVFHCPKLRRCFSIQTALGAAASFVAAATLAPEATVHHAALGFHNVLSPEGYANVRVGRLLLLDFIRPEHRFLTAFGNPIATTAETSRLALLLDLAL